jgi:hypothetical protein
MGIFFTDLQREVAVDIFQSFGVIKIHWISSHCFASQTNPSTPTCINPSKSTQRNHFEFLNKFAQIFQLNSKTGAQIILDLKRGEIKRKTITNL